MKYAYKSIREEKKDASRVASEGRPTIKASVVTGYFPGNTVMKLTCMHADDITLGASYSQVHVAEVAQVRAAPAPRTPPPLPFHSSKVGLEIVIIFLPPLCMSMPWKRRALEKREKKN